MILEKMIEEGQGTIIDVRSPAEFMGGHATDSINIPLNELPARIEEFRTMTQPLIVCCASGNRSGKACRFLLTHDIACHNAGSWLDINFIQSRQKSENYK